MPDWGGLRTDWAWDGLTNETRYWHLCEQIGMGKRRVAEVRTGGVVTRLTSESGATRYAAADQQVAANGRGPTFGEAVVPGQRPGPS